MPKNAAEKDSTLGAIKERRCDWARPRLERDEGRDCCVLCAAALALLLIVLSSTTDISSSLLRPVCSRLLLSVHGSFKAISFIKKNGNQIWLRVSNSCSARCSLVFNPSSLHRPARGPLPVV